jgi:hypothetical protein
MEDFPYVVIKHTLRNINGLISGVKFRDGYAVVKKGSKIYNTIKKLPLIKNTQDYPLTHLKNLKFITRSLDIKLIYGKEIYNEYIKQITPIELEEKEAAVVEQHVAAAGLCAFKNQQGKLCDMVPTEESLKGYCKRHILEDELAVEKAGIRIPKIMTKSEKANFRERVLQALQR